MAQIGGKMFQKFLEVASPHMPLLKDSKFKETGFLPCMIYGIHYAI